MHDKPKRMRKVVTLIHQDALRVNVNVSTKTIILLDPYDANGAGPITISMHLWPALARSVNRVVRHLKKEDGGATEDHRGHADDAKMGLMFTPRASVFRS